MVICRCRSTLSFFAALALRILRCCRWIFSLPRPVLNLLFSPYVSKISNYFFYENFYSNYFKWFNFDKILKRDSPVKHITFMQNNSKTPQELRNVCRLACEQEKFALSINNFTSGLNTHRTCIRIILKSGLNPQDVKKLINFFIAVSKIYAEQNAWIFSNFWPSLSCFLVNFFFAFILKNLQSNWVE